MRFTKHIKILSDIAFWGVPALAIVFKDIHVLDYELLVASLEGIVHFLENKSYSKVKSFMGLFLFIVCPIIFFIAH